SVRIDDGPPILLPTTAAGGAYLHPAADAIFLALPPGVSVAPGQSVTLDAPADWADVDLVRTPALSGLAVANYAGRPISEGLWPDAKPIRVGTNAGWGACGYYPTQHFVRNLALHFGDEKMPR